MDIPLDKILTKHQKKALCIVLSAGYGLGKDSPNDVRDIFIKNYKGSHAFVLGESYTNALNILGLDKFWDEEQKLFLNERITDDE